LSDLPYQIPNERKFWPYVHISKTWIQDRFAGCYFSWVSVESEVLTAVKIQIKAFGNMTACSSIDKYQHFAGIYSLCTGSEVLTAVNMNTRVFWDIGPCSLFRRNMLLPASLWFLAWLIHRPRRLRRCIPPKFRSIFNVIHGVLFQKRILFP
jgi:hypothetical protein